MSALALHFEAPVSYARAVRVQEALVRARIAGICPDVVLFLEHEPVVTLGVRDGYRHLRVPEDELRRRGITLARSSRGGDVTYHGPGQLVLYPIVQLGEQEADSHGYLRNLEDVAMATAADFGVRAFRRPNLTGAWTKAGKLAAIGIRLKRWVTFHGMSFNVDVDLTGFETIVPCGLDGEPVTSLKALLGPDCPAMQEVRERAGRHFSHFCGRALDVRPFSEDLLRRLTGGSS